MTLVAVLLGLPFIIYASSTRDPHDYTLWDRAVVALCAPVQHAVVFVLDAGGAAWHGYAGLRHVQADNDRLRAQVDRLTSQTQRLQEALQQMEQVRALMGMRERTHELPTLHAQVIAASPSPLFRSIRIDRGRRDGVRLGAAVLSHDGVVGRVAALGEGNSDVMLLIDANASTDVLVQRTRARARVRGRGGDTDFALDAQHLSRVAEIEPGDLLITGGLGRTFPKGLPVGRVMGIERRAFGLYQRAIVQPSVDFGRLEHVLVVTGAVAPGMSATEPELPAGGEGEGRLDADADAVNTSMDELGEAL